MSVPKPIAEKWLHAALGLPPEATPFPWQGRLLELFLRANEGQACPVIPRALDLPTGLGKTSVMAIWLVARALGAPLPRRLVYVVDRRAVVDQATETALGLRAWVGKTHEVADALGLGDVPLPISTLRGQFADNREWLDDPSRLAIVVGTVDMVGSRLLFEGYGTSRKMRPYQAGLLGVDTLFVIDEAHLVPPFEYLVETITRGEHMGPAFTSAIGPTPRLLSLSATGRDHGEATFRLDEADRAHAVVNQRLRATKRVVVAPEVPDKDLPKALAIRAWEQAKQTADPCRMLVFVSRRTYADKARAELEKLARTEKIEIDTELFVGARRVRERVDASCWLAERGFLAGSGRPDRHAFVFATAAGEVGVDLDADHAVADVVAWERMVQRLGRVNRRGEGDAVVHVLPTDAKGHDFETKAVQKTLATLPRLADGSRDGSPLGLEALAETVRADEELQAVLATAKTPEPLRPALSRALLDAWAMTSLREHTGRPEVGPWLRGWADERPNTTVAWRSYLHEAMEIDLAAYLEAAPIHLSERLETQTDAVLGWLFDLKKRLGKKSGTSTPCDEAVILEPGGDVRDRVRISLLSATASGRKRLHRQLAGATLVVDASLGGLNEFGLLDPSINTATPAADASPAWSSRVRGGEAAAMDPASVAEGESDDDDRDDSSLPFRVRERRADLPPPNAKDWRESLRLPLKVSTDGDVERWLVVERYRSASSTEDARSTAPCDQTLEEHQAWAAGCATGLAERLGLPEPIAIALRVAARLHDEGKAATVWQDAFSAPSDGRPYAKTRGPLNVHKLRGYRHELGSLPVAERDAELQELPEDLRDLVLHLIAAHHGFARPVIGIDGCEDAPPSVVRRRAQAIARRFAHLSKTWGPWGLAYLEALMRAADQQASRALDDGRQP